MRDVGSNSSEGEGKKTRERFPWHAQVVTPLGDSGRPSPAVRPRGRVPEVVHPAFDEAGPLPPGPLFRLRTAVDFILLVMVISDGYFIHHGWNELGLLPPMESHGAGAAVT